MARNIAAYTRPGLAPAGEMTPFVSINREENGDVTVTARDAMGQMVTVPIPADAWFPMARQIFQSRSRASMTVEFGHQR